jgi:hypothetical protein
VFSHPINFKIKVFMSTQRNPLLDNSGLALAAITAFLYCASSAYTGGYYSRLGLDGDVLDRNFQQILFEGFLISFKWPFMLFILYPIVWLFNRADSNLKCNSNEFN